MAENKANSKKEKKNGYDPSTIEPKWQSKWEKEGIYQPDLDVANKNNSFSMEQKSSVQPAFDSEKSKTRAKEKSSKKKEPFYNLMMFPYPSAEGLHVGSIYTFGGIDVYGRFKRMRGYEVFEPIGLDGFGIHSENHAIKTNMHPIDHAKRTQDNFYRQLHAIGNSYAWKNKLETYDPDYYRWTQWIFVQLFKSDLAYKKNSPVNFCPSCKTVLSDEQVIDGKCERCGSVVEKRDLEQWFFNITKYAERLLGNIKDLNWTEKVKLAQKNWIGKKEGINITYKMVEHDENIICFTTTPVNYGATFIVIAPEHTIVRKILNKEIPVDPKIFEQIKRYVKTAQEKSDIDRLSEGKEKTGVFTGLHVMNHVTAEEIPVWISDFVLADVGTGAVQGCPAHDKRDFEFATKFGLPIKRVVTGPNGQTSPVTSAEQVVAKGAHGKMVNSEFLNGLEFADAMEKTMNYFEKKGWGKRVVTYHLRDWLISRQRYWGPPIPMIYCAECAKRRLKVLILHGIGGDSSDNWFPWVKPALKQKGYDVLIPDLPDPNNPTLEEWTTALNKLGITKNDRLIIVAHSLGAPTAVAFVKQNKLPVEKLILVSPTGKEQGEKNWEVLRKVGYEHAEHVTKSFNKANEEIERIKGLVAKTILYLSDNDPYIPLSVEKSYEALHPKVEILKNHGHFNASAGIFKFPKILDEFPEVEQGNPGWYPVPEEDLPVKLPYIKNFKPLGTGRAPLANHPEFYETTCPGCGGKATRETDVSDTFLDSSWYFLRYLATDWKNIPFPSEKYLSEHSENSDSQISGKSDRLKLRYAEYSEKIKSRSHWLPVTSYIGGAEHSVLHLLYARFITMALKDMGYLDFEEPFTRFYAHGLIIKDGAKMSKSKGNIINPDDYIRKYGADTLRTYLLFLGPFDQGGDFRDSGIDGMSRFLKRVWKLLSNSQRSTLSVQLSDERLRMMHQTIKGVTEDLEHLRFNTAIAKLMSYYNFLSRQSGLHREEVEVYLKLFAPFAPHMTEELWQALPIQKSKVPPKARLANSGKSQKFQSIHTSEWPMYDEKYLKEETVTIAVQVNGKLRSTITLPVQDKDNKEMLEKMAKEDEHVLRFLTANVKKVILVPGKILNFVI
jgi:leucyl-tRNA synthetase